MDPLAMTPEPTTKKSLRTIILTQCVGVIAILLFSNGFMLTYLSRLGIPSYRILFLLSLVPLTSLFTTMPFAYLSDRFGKKWIGNRGLLTLLAGLLLLTAAGSFEKQAELIAVGGILIIALGGSANTSSWFALLSPIIPKEIRGRFFATLRISWQLCGIVFTLILTALLEIFTQIRFFQYVLVFVIGMTVLRIHLYRKIPELESGTLSSQKIWTTLSAILRIPSYLPFCAYAFLLTLVIGSIPWVFGLLGKDALLFSDAQIFIMSNFGAVGAIFGFYFGGKMVDKFGTKPVFLICHLSFSSVLLLAVLRGLLPFSPIAAMSLVSGLFGLSAAASSIAFSSELLAIIPVENKSLSTGFYLSLTSAGTAFSSLLIGQALKLDLLNPEWMLMNQTLSVYDTILIGSAVATLLLLITVGLIPSVIQVRKAQWYPQNR